VRLPAGGAITSTTPRSRSERAVAGRRSIRLETDILVGAHADGK